MRPSYLLSCLLLAGCAASVDLPTVLSQPADSSVQHRAAEQRAQALVGQLTTGKVKFNGPVVLQMGGTGNTANATDATKAKAPVAAAPNASATETTSSSGPPWYVYVGLGLVCFAAGVLARPKLSFLP